MTAQEIALRERELGKYEKYIKLLPEQKYYRLTHEEFRQLIDLAKKGLQVKD